MSKSYRLPWIKDRPRNKKKSTLYWRVVRRVLKQLVKQDKEPKNPKEIVNDYDYCDWIWRLDKPREGEYDLFGYDKCKRK